jgi:hypothetical protein
METNEKRQNFTSINEKHDETLIDHFKENTGKKTFILSPSFPFLFVGKIKEVIEDLVVLDVKTTHYAQFENRDWHIHIHAIETFYIEEKGLAKIPELKEE